jgi:hypothetical protein
MTKLEDNTAPVDDDEVGGEDWDNAFDEFYEEELKDDKQDDSADMDTDGDSDDDAASDNESVADDDKDDKKNSDDKDVVLNTDDKEEKPDLAPGEDQRQVVKDALKEVYTEQNAANERISQLADEAISMIHPEGIPDPRTDSDGDPIKSAKEVEQLYNPATGENYTPEEAREWFAQATAKYEENVNSAYAEASRVAEVSMNLDKGREAVMRSYGDFINENPDIAQKVLSRYMATLKTKGEGENAYVVDAPVDILEFYNDVMYPYVELAEKKKEADEAAAAAEEKKQADLKKAKAHRDESRDFPTSVGDDATKTGDDMDWDDAFKQYYGSK